MAEHPLLITPKDELVTDENLVLLLAGACI